MYTFCLFQTLLVICVIMALILSTVALFIFSSIINRDLRSKSPMWYLYQMIPLCMFAGFILHPFTYFGVITDRGVCFFVMYTAEYIFFGMGVLLFLFNIEVYFTKVLPLPKWQTCTFYRFVIMSLSGWLVASLLVTHVVIDNNHAKKFNSNAFCMIIPDSSARYMRVIMREMLSAVLCFIMMIITLATGCLKRSRMSGRWPAGELREVRADCAADERQWVMCIMFCDIVWMVRAISLAISHISVEYTLGSAAEFRLVGVMLKIHALSLYFIPFSTLFIEEVRRTLGIILFKSLHVVSMGRLKFGDDTESLAVSFGNVNASDN